MKGSLSLKAKLDSREWQRDKVKPHPESLMELQHLPTSTVCGVLREIYEKTTDDEIKYLSRLAITMAKKISNKLLFYYEKS